MNVVDELLSVVESVQGRALQESDAGWQAIAELDARIAVAAEGAFPNVPLAACESFGFCRIPINRTISQTASFIHLMTEPGFLEPSGKWRQAMAILRLTIRQPAKRVTPATVPPTTKPIPKQGISLRSAAEILAHRGGEGIGTTNEILTKFRKFSHEFQKTGFARKPRNKPLFSVQTMAELIVKCGYADSVKTASQNLKTKFEDCRDS